MTFQDLSQNLDHMVKQTKHQEKKEASTHGSQIVGSKEATIGSMPSNEKIGILIDLTLIFHDLISSFLSSIGFLETSS